MQVYYMSRDKLGNWQYQVTYHLLKRVLQLVTLAKGHDHDTVQCRLLDCDTISQAKEKALDAIYLNIPASRRPPAHSRDLG